MTEKPVRDYDKFMLRFPDGMRDIIAERAKSNGRSMNSEIVQILQDAIDGEKNTFYSKTYEIISNGDFHKLYTKELLDQLEKNFEKYIVLNIETIIEDKIKEHKTKKIKNDLISNEHDEKKSKKPTK
ncbi:Arc family DNA-binding protein [Salmonella enterica]